VAANANIFVCLKKIFIGEYNTRNLPIPVYKKILAQMQGSLRMGFGSKAGYRDLYDNLKDSVDLFSSAKTYQLTRELQSAKKGVKNFDEYEEIALPIINKYKVWGEAEATTITAQALQAKQWQSIIADADILPNLRYSAIGDACSICKPLDGIVAPVNAPIWTKYSPVNHYNCFCIIVQERGDVKVSSQSTIDVAVKNADEKVEDVFKHNAGITQEVFTKDHPYFDIPKKDLGFAKRNFDLPI
jgi:hypothetical protein